jgi:hypothetical protein
MDPDTIWNAIFGQESNYGQNNRTSVTGAVGPGQIQPATFAQYAQPGENINNSNDNIAVSKRIVQDYYNKFNGDPGRIATAYFSGPGNVSSPDHPLPWKSNAHDPNGKYVSQYVSDISGRLKNMPESVPDYLGQSVKNQAVSPAQDEAPVTDYLNQFGAPPNPTTFAQRFPSDNAFAPTPGTPSQEFAKGAAHGSVNALSHILSTGGQAAQIEMGQPVDVPSSEDTFNIAQRNVTGTLAPGQGLAGQLGENIGGAVPYVATMPSAAGVIPRLVQSGLMGAGATAGEALTKGTPYESIGGLAGGVLAPTAAPYLASKVASSGGKLLAGLSGTLTGTGADPIVKAFETGAQGGEVGQAFRNAISGGSTPQEVVQSAKTALTNMRLDRGAEYRANMRNLAEDSTPLSFDAIDKAMDKAGAIKTFKGQNLSPETADVQNSVKQAIDDWKALDPNEYHTPIGMDALKQRIGSIKDNLPFNTPQRKVAEDAYGAIRQTIAKQAPQYADAMKGYEEASNQIDEISKTLSVNPKASVDTTFRKLLSTMRNNVNTNYGQRVNLMQQLEQSGAPNLSASLAGHALGSFWPRGLAQASTPMELGMAGYEALMHGGMTGLGGVLAAAPAASPRIAGSVAHGLGRLYGGIAPSIGATPAPVSALANLLRGSNQFQKLRNAQQIPLSNLLSVP